MSTSIIECQNEAEWLSQRRNGIGASDAAVVLGVSPWKTPYPLYAEKVGDAEPEDLSEVERIEWGHRLELPIQEAYIDRTGRPVIPWPKFQIACHPDLDYVRCTPDARQRENAGADSRDGPLQIKTTNAFADHEWRDEPPLYYQVQLQHEIAVLEAEWGTLCVLIGGQKMRWFDMQRNQPFIDAMVEKEAEFWQRVMNRNPPPIDDTPACSKALQQLHPDDSGESIILPDEAGTWDSKLAELRESIKIWEAEKREIENKLKAAIGDATYGILPNGGRYSWRTQTRKAHQVKESKSRVLRRLKK